MTVEDQLKAYAETVETRLADLLPSENDRPPELARAIRYSCLGAGKRLRPALCLASCEAVGGSVDQALDLACAIEMVHCFSLIHDDLPALDDDDLRRGRPTCHVQFGEAMAILAGDGLFALAFETAAKAKLTSAQALDCVRLLAECSGMSGLVAGEAADILGEGAPVSLELLQFIHSHKTGALIRASCEIGATAGSLEFSSTRQLGQFGRDLGLAFQIADDVLDETSTREQLGKSVGADREKSKATYPRLLGIEQSRAMAVQLSESAIQHLQGLPGPTDFLRDLAGFSVQRSR